jgi:hypothetical protein
MVIGSRYLSGKKTDTPFYRRVGQKVLDVVTFLKVGVYTTDSQSGFRAYGPNTKGIFTFPESGMGLASQMFIEAVKAGLRVREVRIDVRYDVGRSTLNPLVHGLSVMAALIK